MIQELSHTLRLTRLRSPALALVATLSGAACSNTDPLATSTPSDPPPAATTSDTATATDSLGTALATSGTVGLPFGAYRLLVEDATPAPLTLNFEMNSPSTIVSRIGYARQRGTKMLLQMTGGPHSARDHGCCLSVINGVLQFDRKKWNAKM